MSELRTPKPEEVSFTAKLIEAVQLYGLTASLLEDQLSMGTFRNFYKEKTSTYILVLSISNISSNFWCKFMYTTGIEPTTKPHDYSLSIGQVQ